jgi:hypothetical protein
MREFKHKKNGQKASQRINGDYSIYNPKPKDTIFTQKQEIKDYLVPSWVIEESPDWEEIKQGITTHDNVYISDGNSIVYILDEIYNFKSVALKILIDSRLDFKRVKIFAFFENAVKFYELNKTKFSEQEVITNINKHVNTEMAVMIFKEFGINMSNL